MAGQTLETHIITARSTPQAPATLQVEKWWSWVESSKQEGGGAPLHYGTGTLIVRNFVEVPKALVAVSRTVTVVALP